MAENKNNIAREPKNWALVTAPWQAGEPFKIQLHARPLHFHRQQERLVP